MVTEGGDVVRLPDGATHGVALMLCVEMCSNFPYWSSTWDDRKGAIDADTKRYIAQLSSRAHELQIPLHFIVLGSSLEDPDIDYLLRARDHGHVFGNHTYSHLFVKARTIPSLQAVYQKQPWRANGRAPLQIIRDEIHQTTLAIRERLGVAPAGLRTPGGFATALHDAPELQQVLLEEGFSWASSHYHLPITQTRRPDADSVAAAVRASVDELQPYHYAGGLLEIPTAGMSDVWAFRVLDLDRSGWLNACRAALDRTREIGGFLVIDTHPAVLAARDPFCDTLALVAAARDQGAWIATMGEMAERLDAVPERMVQ
jgi:peptidoglycan/xylan/chitin deacetylase (PgdA/CDA1 family)